MAKEATVLILYNISSARPPAFSHVFLPKIIPVFKAFTKKSTSTIIKGATQSIIRAIFQEIIKANTKEMIHDATIWITKPTFSPIPNSICSNWACTLVANSKALFASNQPCSWDRITVKYCLFNLWQILLPIRHQKQILKKFATNAIAPKIKNLLICLLNALFTLSSKIKGSSAYSEVLPISPIKSDEIYAIIGKERPAPIEPIIASIR